MRYCVLAQEMACWFNSWKFEIVSFDWSNDSDAIDVKMDGYVL